MPYSYCLRSRAVANRALNNANSTSALAVSHEYKFFVTSMTDRDLALLFDRMIRIWKSHRQRVQENRRSVYEQHLMFLDVGCGLSSVPLIDHAVSLPVSRIESISSPALGLGVFRGCLGGIIVWCSLHSFDVHL